MSEFNYQTGQTDTRPWGSWKVEKADLSFILKTIKVNPGQRLSLQYHYHRSEHWVVVAGSGEITIGGDILPVQRGSHVYIPKETKHRVSNYNNEVLVFVEVQFGDKLEEQDIVRLEDDYARSSKQT